MFDWLRSQLDPRFPVRGSGWEGIEAWLASPGSEWFRTGAVANGRARMFGQRRLDLRVDQVLHAAGLRVRVANSRELGERARAAVLRDGLPGTAYSPLF